MALAELVKKILPREVRRTINQTRYREVIIDKSKLLIYLYYYFWSGHVPKNLTLLPNNDCFVTYKDYKIKAPRDGIGCFVDILQRNLYGRIWEPQAGDVVLDIGAYVGVFTIKAANLVGGRGAVIAIEPEPRTLTYLRENIEGFPNVAVVEKAVYSKPGYSKLHTSSFSMGASLTNPRGKDYYEVELDTLDNIVSELELPKIDFIKMDIEGAELEALIGAINVLTNNRVRLSIASYHILPNGEPELPSIVGFLEGLGYKTYTHNLFVYAERKNESS